MNRSSIDYKVLDLCSGIGGFTLAGAIAQGVGSSRNAIVPQCGAFILNRLKERLTADIRSQPLRMSLDA